MTKEEYLLECNKVLDLGYRDFVDGAYEKLQAQKSEVHYFIGLGASWWITHETLTGFVFYPRDLWLMKLRDAIGEEFNRQREELSILINNIEITTKHVADRCNDLFMLATQTGNKTGAMLAGYNHQDMFEDKIFNQYGDSPRKEYVAING